MIQHNLETNHNFNFKGSKMLVNIHNKKGWRVAESNIISNNNTIEQRPSSFNLFSQIHIKKL